MHVPFGKYKPDLPAIRNDGLTVARNVRPKPNGYEGVNSLATISSSFTALTDFCRGAIGGIDPDGNPYNFAGDSQDLYKLQDLTENVSQTVNGYNCSGDSYWDFVIMGTGGRHHVIACNRSDATQYYTVGLSTKFADLGNPTLTETVAPRASTAGVIGSFLMLGNTVFGSYGSDPTSVHWSAVNDPFNWPDPGTDVAHAVQSGRQPLSGPGGAVQRVVSGSEVGAIFQERAIWRVDYRGGDVIFEFTQVEAPRGLLVPAIAVPIGRNIFYLSEDGFYLFDYTTSEPVGRGVVDRTFLSEIRTDAFHRVSAVADPDRQQLWIAYPTSSSGNPDKILLYDWALNQFSHIDIDVEWLSVSAGLHQSLDSPGVIGDPDTTTDDPAYPDGGVDSAGLPSFDERIADPGRLQLGAYNTSHVLQQFTGTQLAGTIELGALELAPMSRTLVSEAQIIVDNVDPTIQWRPIGRSNAVGKWSRESKVNAAGFAPTRSEGRYHNFRVNLPPGFDNAVGMDLKVMRTGRR